MRRIAPVHPCRGCDSGMSTGVQPVNGTGEKRVGRVDLRGGGIVAALSTLRRIGSVGAGLANAEIQTEYQPDNRH